MSRILIIPQARPQALALRMVLQNLLDVQVYLHSAEEEIRASISQKTDSVIIVSVDMKAAIDLFWEKIRIDLLNPVILLGNVDQKSFLEDNPMFMYAQRYHQYIPMPWHVVDVICAIERIVPIHDNQSRAMLYEKYSDRYLLDRLYWLIYHDLKLADKHRDMRVLEDALRLAQSLHYSKLENVIKNAVETRNQDQINKVQLLKSEAIDLICNMQEQINK